MRKQTNVAARAEHRDELKAAQPAPMIKEIHEIRDEGDAVAELFLGKFGITHNRCKLDLEVQVVLNTTKSHLELVLLNML